MPAHERAPPGQRRRRRRGRPIRAAVAIVLGAGVALAHLGADWFLFIFLGAGLAVAYLALTSASHVDLLYTALDIDTRHRRADVLTIEDERDPDVAASRAP